MTHYGTTVATVSEPKPGSSKAGEAKTCLTCICTPSKAFEKRTRQRKAHKAEVLTSSPDKKQLLDKKKSVEKKRKKKRRVGRLQAQFPFIMKNGLA